MRIRRQISKFAVAWRPSSISICLWAHHIARWLQDKPVPLWDMMFDAIRSRVAVAWSVHPERRARDTGAAVYTRVVVLLYAATQEGEG